EMKRGGPWIVPTLKGAPRTAKPPLTNWIVASLVSEQTVHDLSIPPAREQAYRRLAWQLRWPALAASCLMLVAAAWLGRILIGDTAGLLTELMAGCSALSLKFGHAATTDVHLALWVTCANVLFAVAIFGPQS